MTRKALLFGAQTHGLKGVRNDVKAMTNALDRWGFACVFDENACREAILDGYRKLIADARPDDAIVVYFSGHGSFCVPAGTPALAWPSTTRQFLLPTDYSEDPAEEFRGITAVELSGLAAQLTDRTKNVTVILDCCHSGHLSRDPGVIVKSPQTPTPYERLERHLARLGEQGGVPARPEPHSNPHAVRIVACAPEQLAFESLNSSGVPMGRLTDGLTRALHAVKDNDLSLSWSTLMDHVRHEILNGMPWQRPEAEGPAKRLLFDVREGDPFGTLPVQAQGEKLIVQGGRLAGIHLGDEFVIMPADSPDPDPRTHIGEMRVTEIDLATCQGPLRPRVPGSTVSLGARAHLVKAAAPAMPVRVPRQDPRCAELITRIEATPLLRLAGTDEPAEAEVLIDDAGICAVHDRVGPLCHFGADTGSMLAALRALKRLARAAAVRRLSTDIDTTIPVPPTLEFGIVEAGATRPLPASSATVQVGQTVYLAVRNDRRAQPIYVSLLDIGVSSKISLWNTAAPSGQLIDPEDEFMFGRDPYTGALPGMKLVWPDDLADRRPRPETLVVLITSQRMDARIFEEAGVRAFRRLGSSLERTLAQLDGDGQRRDVERADFGGLNFAVNYVHFTLAAGA